MDGIAIEYIASTPGAPSAPRLRAAWLGILAAQPGYRRLLLLQTRLPLVTDGRRRFVDLVLFDGPAAARAALASEAWRALAAADPACRDAALARLVHASPRGDLVVLLRSSPHPARGDQGGWHDHLAHAAPAAVLW